MGQLHSKLWLQGRRHGKGRYEHQHLYIRPLFESKSARRYLHRRVRERKKDPTTPGLSADQGADQVLGLGDEAQIPILSLRVDQQRDSGITCAGSACGESELLIQ